MFLIKSGMARESIRTLRKLKNLSQAALAKMTGLMASEISRIECGYRDLSRAEASMIAKALGVAVHEITDEPRSDAAKSSAVVILESSPAVQAPIPPPASGPNNDLADPPNFQELPSFDLLKRGDLEAGAFRAQLCGAVDRATTILHTSKVPAPIWRAWRDFEKKAQAILRGSVSGGPSASPQSGTSGRSLGETRWHPGDMLALAERSFKIGRSSRTRHQEKSYSALFLEAARKILPHDLAAELTVAAELRLQRDRSVGFMRHFRDVAHETLSQDELRRIVDAIRVSETDARRDCH